MEARAKAFALRVVRFVGALPREGLAEVLGRPLLRSGASIGANERGPTGQSPAGTSSPFGWRIAKSEIRNPNSELS